MLKKMGINYNRLFDWKPEIIVKGGGSHNQLGSNSCHSIEFGVP
jgi:hypothetical protein